MAKTLPVCLLVFSLEGLVTQKFSWELVLISYWFFSCKEQKAIQGNSSQKALVYCFMSHYF